MKANDTLGDIYVVLCNLICLLWNLIMVEAVHHYQRHFEQKFTPCPVF